jgi:hypothetical protein
MRMAVKSDHVFVNERGQPFARMGIGGMIERAGEAAEQPSAQFQELGRVLYDDRRPSANPNQTLCRW